MGVGALSSGEEWTAEFEVDGTSYTAMFFRRPFREGIEVSVEAHGEVITISEFGFGEQALIEALKGRIQVLKGSIPK